MWRYEKLCCFLCLLSLVLAIMIVVFNLLHSPTFSPNSITLGETVPAMAETSVSDQTETKAKAQSPVNTGETLSQSEDSSSGSDSEGQRYNLNTVTFDQLLEVPGIGEVKAEAILEMRDDLGGFTSVEQLLDVSGIGDATYDKIAPYFYVN